MRTEIGWLELWVFMCSGARQPKVEAYLSKNPEELEQLMTVKVDQRKRQSITRNMKDINKAKQEFMQQVEEI